MRKTYFIRDAERSPLLANTHPIHALLMSDPTHFIDRCDRLDKSIKKGKGKISLPMS
jgi:hypothetical protein